MNDLRTAIGLHQSGKLKEARAIYAKIVRKAPNHEVLKLLGTTYYQSKEFDQAIPHYRHSLSLSPKQTDTTINLAICYLHIGDKSSAATEFLNAISYGKANIELIKFVGKTLLDHNANIELDELLTSLPSHIQQHPDISTLKAKNHVQLGQHQLAIDALNSVMLVNSTHTQALHTLGIAYRALGDSNKAVENFEKLIELGVSDFSVHHNLANAYNDAGNYELAIKHYKKSISANQFYPESHKNLNSLLWTLDRREEFLESYQHVDWSQPQASSIAVDALEYYYKLGEFKKIAQILSSSHPDTLQMPEIRIIIGKTLLSQGNIARGLNEIATGAEHVKAASLVCECAEILIKHDRSKRAAELINMVLTADHENIYATGLAHTLQRLGHQIPEAIQGRFGNKLVKEFRSSVTPESTEKLKLAILDLHQTSSAPLEQTLVNGTQSNGNLFHSNNPDISAALDQIKQRARDYLFELPKDHFIRQCLPNPDTLELSGAWSVILNDEGYHGMHIHPMGILSAVYYIEIPPEVTGKDHEKMGWLKFGEPNFSHPQLKAEQFLQPTPGTIAIFPSYFWHGTVPFKSKYPRITIAVDIISAQKQERSI